MWVYHSPIGNLYIKRLHNERYGLVYNNTVWESCHSPQAEADNVYSHVTGCYDWDRLDGQISDVPADLSEWEFVNT